MAATGAAIPTATNSDSPAANSSQRDRGRGRGGGRGGPRRGFGGAGGRGLADDTRQDRQRGGFGGDLARSRGQRGGRGRDQRNRAASQSQSVDVQNEGPAVVQQPTPQTEGVQDGRHDSTNGEEGEVCFICAGTVDHWAIVPCNHRTCHICALRSRALYKSKACLHCRTEAATVIFTDEAEKRYENFSEEDFFRKDDNLGIAYDKPMEIFEDTVLLLRYNCPDSSCDVACMGWPDLHRHVKSVHHKTMCDLCIRNKKLFTHEHTLFTQPELRKHEKFGDNTPGAIDQSGFEGHPECGFCRQRFYGEDELYAHCRDRHERCHLCDRRTGGRNPQYYVDYNALEQHFGKDHWPCLDNECLEKKFVVFDSEMDLKAHQLENHPNGLSKDARRDARRVDISSFDYRPQYQETRRGGRRAGRGRDPNAEGVPAVSSGHMSRAEVAHQRAREIQSAQSGSSRTFEGQLTQTEPQAQTVHRPAQAQSPRPNNALPHAPSQLTAPASPRPVEALTPQEQARRMRHAVVTERAANLLQNDQMKLAEFRERISAYRIGTISAPDLIDAFFSLFDTSSAELGKLIKELAEIFEVTGKRDALLKAWSDWKAINEDYPSLPGPAGNTSSASVIGAGVGSSRVLKLKSSTAQSSRSAMGQQQKTWGSAAASPGNPFPSLSAANGAGAKPAPTPGWLSLRPAAGASKSGSTSSSARPSPTPSRSQSSVALPRRDAFPALPAARKPTSSVFSPGYTGAGVIRQSTGSSANAWAGGGGVMSNGNGTTAPLSGAGEEAEIGKGKGKKKKDQVMFRWG